MLKQPQHILSEAIEAFRPRQIVCLFSGGYDSMVATHLAHQLGTHGYPMSVWSIDTKLSADGWLEFVRTVAEELQFQDAHVYDNQHGFDENVELVRKYGCPYSPKGHTTTYQRLKERAMDAIHMMYKRNVHDKTLFVSGMRRAESAKRAHADEYHQVKRSNKCFVAPIVHWSDEEVTRYRIENDLPENPFYATVKGSGDCQCNWGNFIDYDRLERYSPLLAAGNVALLDTLSRDNHGYGWDEEPPVRIHKDQLSLLPEAELNGPFLCTNCSRRGNKHALAEQVLLQRGI
jgi:3'-phosphoadenosine 5'-phosphosulfate sulfotransferase (PAPS reductase)/FAD synthetase